MPTVFLDIHAKVVAGGERGLLGLAFHPRYAYQRPLLRLLHARGRRRDRHRRVPRVRQSERRQHDRDGAAHDPASDQHQPQRRHARVRARRLSLHRRRRRRLRQRPAEQRAEHRRAARQDPAHRRRSPDPLGCTPYSSPPTTRSSASAGRDEIFSIGWRNPWRFSFDRDPRQQWVADVGQGAREEVDTPIVNGGNYGWRVFEGFACTGNDPALCIPPTTSSPIFDYTHRAAAARSPAATSIAARRMRCRTEPTSTATTAPARSSRGTARRRRVLLDTALEHLVVRRRRAGRALCRRPRRDAEQDPSASADVHLVIAPTSLSIAAPGTRGASPSRPTDGCVWTAAANAPWIHVTRRAEAATATSRTASTPIRRRSHAQGR